MTISIIIADDHPVVRMGLRSLLSRQAGFQVIGEAADGEEAVRLAQDLRPQVLVVDLLMPRLNGMQVVERVRKTAPGMHIIILSMYSDRSYVNEALQLGADGYVVKDSMAEEIVHAIRTVAAGKRHFPEDPTDTGRTEAAGAGRRDRPCALTTREDEILALIARGQANKEIAGQLGISVRTVEVHRARIMRKLSLQTHASLIHYAAIKYPPPA
jgi:two-component system response regulator NreC